MTWGALLRTGPVLFAKASTAFSFSIGRNARRHPELCCEIYGREGKAGNYEGLPLARRTMLQGLGLICIALVFIVYEAKGHLQWIWGYIIGLKLLVVGVVFVVRGIAGLREYRGERLNADSSMR